jgi:hypothetical protein
MTLLKKLRDATVALFEFEYCPLKDVVHGKMAGVFYGLGRLERRT